MLSGLAYVGMPAPFRLENFSFYDCFRFAIFLIRFFGRARKKHRVYWRMREHFDDVMAEKRSKNGFVYGALCLKQRNLTKSLKKIQKCVDKLSNFYYNESCFHKQCGGIAQLARACGSYPQCRWFKSIYRYHSGA